MATRNVTVLIKTRDQASKALERAERSTLKWKNALLAVGGALAALGVARVVKDLFAIGAAADETASKFRTVFGPAVNSVQAFVDDFASMAGLSEAAARDITATVGAIAQGFGFAQDASAEFSQSVVRLAGDLASFNNLPTERTASAITSALAGEREQLKQLGIIIRQANVDQRALIISGKETVSQLNEQERATATLQLITEKAGVAVGDLERTQDSTANTVKRLAAEFTTLKENIGLVIAATPGLTGVFRFLADRVREVNEEARALRDADEAFSQITSSAEKTGFAIAQQALEVQFFREELAEEQNRLALIFGEMDAALSPSVKRLGDALADAQERLAKLQEAARKFRLGPAGAVDGIEAPPIGELPELALFTLGTAEEEVAKQAAEASANLDQLGTLITELPARTETAIESSGRFAEVMIEATSSLDEFNFRVEGTGVIAREVLNPAIKDTISTMEQVIQIAQIMGTVLDFTFLGAALSAAIGAKGMAKALIGAQKAIAKVLALIETARGIAKLAASIFPPNPAGLASAAQHFAAAAKFAAIAGTSAGGRGGGAGGGAGGASLPQQPAALRPDPSRTQTPQEITVVLVTPNAFGPDEIRRFTYEVNRFANRDGVTVLPTTTLAPEPILR